MANCQNAQHKEGNIRKVQGKSTRSHTCGVRGWADGCVRGAHEESESDWTSGEHKVRGRGAESSGPI